jgi:hypothetical protein
VSSSSDAKVYLVHGLKLRSALPLPGPTLPDTTSVDATIELGNLDLILPGVTYAGPLIQVARGAFQLNLPGIARYRATRDAIVVHPLASVAPRDLAVFVLNRAIPALMLMRGHLPLEATAVMLPTGATLLCGNTAKGKSTLAATLRSRGHALLSDGVCYLSPSEEPNQGVTIRPGLPYFSLWFDAMDALGETRRPEARLRQGDLAPRFYTVSMPEFQPRFEVIKQVVVMSTTGPKTSLQPVTNAVMRLLSFIIMNHFVDALGSGENSWALACALCEQCPIGELLTPWVPITKQSLDKLADEFLDLCA